MKKEIKVKYDGEYPNLCSGKLILVINGIEWDFGNCLNSGGSVSFDKNWSEIVTQGKWSITKYPKDFPKELEGAALDAINSNIEWGCCGGCV